ncbi:MAG: Rieske 2Fe-2S domain-containing protein [Chloroflexota bacterium]
MSETRPRATRPRSEWFVAALFCVTGLSGLLLLGVYVAGGQTQIEGVLLAVALGALGAGIVVWARDLIVSPVVIEERHPMGSPEAIRDVTADLDPDGSISRRKLLLGTLLVALGGLGAALLIPVLSLGPAPGQELFTTGWRRGSRVVGANGQPVGAADIPFDSYLTVFPEGQVGSADSQTVLIHVHPEELQLAPDRMAWAPEGFVAYSKVCTHAGCPVGLYRAEDRRLICPCHQSTFDVLRGAVPVYGPAARPLPQLPIRLAADGTFTADGDFPEPVGPSFWNMSSQG